MNRWRRGLVLVGMTVLVVAGAAAVAPLLLLAVLHEVASWR